jgi:AbrB family looped-hinge helix DNA binding protein
MAIARSTLTARSQVSVPSDVRRKLGIGPGSILEWHEEGDSIVVRRVGRFSFEDIRQALFGEKSPKTPGIKELKEGIQDYVRLRYAGD